MDVNPAIRCLFHCPLIFDNLSCNEQKLQSEQENEDVIVTKLKALFKEYYIDNKRILPPSLTEDIISDKTHWIHNSVRTENTISKVIKLFLDKLCGNSYKILSLPIPRSTRTIIMTVINLQLQADPSKYDSDSIIIQNDNIFLFYGYIRNVYTDIIPSDIIQIIINFAVMNVCKPTRYLFELPSDATIIDIETALEKLTKIPREKYILHQHHRHSPLNRWSSVHGRDVPIAEVIDGYDDICYVHPTNEEFKRITYFESATKFTVQNVCHEILDNGRNSWKEKFGVGFLIKVPLKHDVPISYIINTINAMIKPYLNSTNEQELPYQLVIIHRLHYRFPYKDCKYEQEDGCRGCDLNEYMDKYKVINFIKEYDLRSFGIRWKTESEGRKLFDHKAFRYPINDDSITDEYVDYYGKEDSSAYEDDTGISLCKKIRDITIYDCLKEGEAGYDLQDPYPSILVLKLQKFIENSGFRYKYLNKEEVIFPIHELSINNTYYDLFAILKHSLNYKYKAKDRFDVFCKNSMDNNWYQFEDGSSKKIEDNEELTRLTQFPDVLFYQKSS